MKIFKNFIGGKWRVSKSGELFDNFNPSRKKELLGKFQLSNTEDAEEALRVAEKAFVLWKKRSPGERIVFVEKFLDNLKNKSDGLAKIVSLEEGKTFKESKAEINSALKEGQYAVRSYSTLTSPYAESRTAEVSCMARIEPLGVVSIISPWNFPVNVMCRKALPALVSGNCVVFKPASFTPWSGTFMAKLIEESGFPPGVFNCITGGGSSLGKILVSHPFVKAVSFTGSTAVGKKINEMASPLLIRTQLEMGGKNALIVMEDADLEKAAGAAIVAGYGCTGQWCTSTSRILVERIVAKKFKEIMLQRLEEIKVGDALDPETKMGPVAGESQYENILRAIEKAKKEGARLLFGGGKIDGPQSDGYFIKPTLFDKVRPAMEIFKKEIFGPVIGMTNFDKFEKALELLNDSDYGLSSSIFTNNLRCIRSYIEASETGLVHVNIHTGYKEPVLPFGGWKDSGNGRPENERMGIEFFTEMKAVYIANP